MADLREITACPNAHTVDQFIGGRLPAAERLELERHFDVCAGCAQLVGCVMAGADVPVTEQLATGSRPGQRPGALAMGGRFGRYIILSRAGQGGMGAVYAAYDTSLGRNVALKLLAAAGAGAGARLFAEAAAMARLDHPNVVTVFDAGVFEGEPYLAMRLVDGQTLADWRRERPRSLREIVTAMAAVASGLAAAHAAGIVHRDVKPSNILVEGRRVLVTDFGLSVDDGAARAGTVSGTPAYMPPEQWNGEPATARSDVFAFCATFYQMLYGVLPFQGKTPEAVREATLAGRLTPPPRGSRPRVPGRLHRLVVQGLAPDPADRPADLAATARMLLRDPAVTRRWLVASIATGALVAAAFLGGHRLAASPQRRCHAGAAVLDSAWNDSRRKAIQARFTALGLASTWPSLERRLDRYAAAWRAGHAETCAASFDRRRQSGAMLDLRMVCLDGRRAALDALASALPSASTSRLLKAVDARLPDIESCGATGLAVNRPLPADPEIRAKITAIEQDVARARTLANLVDFAEAIRLVDQAITRARALGYEPSLASALIMSAEIKALQGGGDKPPSAGGARQEAGEALFLEAMAVAERGGAELARAQVGAELVMVYNKAGRYQEAELWAELTGALLARLGDPPAHRELFEKNVGWLRLQRGDRERARQAFTRALEINRKALGGDEVGQVGAMGGLCRTEPAQADRIACLRRAIAFSEKTLGDRHPVVGTGYSDLFVSLWRDPEKRVEACTLMDKAVAIHRATLDPASPHLMTSLVNFGLCLQQQGRMDEARRLYDDLLERTRDNPFLRGGARQGYARYLRGTGDLGGALTQLRQAIADQKSVAGERDDRVLHMRSIVGEVLIRQGRPAEALAEQDAVLALCAAAKVSPPRLVEVQTVRALALLRLKRAAAALEAAETAAGLVAPAKRPESDEAEPLLVAGRALQALGRPRPALERFERALALRPGGGDPNLRADAAFYLARALAQGPPSPRTCVLAKEALDRFRKAGPARAEELRQAEALWSQLSRGACLNRA
jgi:tetratricopeptide (TPR) repeat protein